MARPNEDRSGITIENPVRDKLVVLRRQLGIDSNPELLRVIAKHSDEVRSVLQNSMNEWALSDFIREPSFDISLPFAAVSV